MTSIIPLALCKGDFTLCGRWSMGLLKRLRDKYFDYVIVSTCLEQIAPGEYQTKHIKKYRLRKSK
jgi:hypothetical protein